MDQDGGLHDADREDLERLGGSYIFQELVQDVPISEDGETTDVWITCVEIWNDNLYIGTSSGELLHFVRIPPDPSESFGEPGFILASRLQPATSQNTGPGIEQILLLPAVSKACILCNGSLTFYTLPELSPAFNNRRLGSCSWVGGVDQNIDLEAAEPENGSIIMVCLKARIRLIRVGEEEVRVIRDIQFGGCLATARRDNFACVADTHSYSLLDVVQQQKVPLFPISSVDKDASARVGGATEDISAPTLQRPVRSSSLVGVLPRVVGRSGDRSSHERSTSLGTFSSGSGQQQQSAVMPSTPLRNTLEPSEAVGRPLSGQSGALSPERAISPAPRAATPDKPLPATPDEQSTSRSLQQIEQLKPHVVSTSSTEFLLTTGTSSSDPGMGIFVNLDGDVVRGTIEFSQYPQAIVIDGHGVDPSASLKPGESQEEGFVLAVVRSTKDDASENVIEIQRWDLDPSETGDSKQITSLPLSQKNSHGHVGIRKTIAKTQLHFADICEKLRLQQVSLSLAIKQTNSGESEVQELQKRQVSDREREEASFADRLTSTESQIVTWSGNQIWWTVRNSLITRLDSRLELAREAQQIGRDDGMRKAVEAVLKDIEGYEFHTELEFLSLNYIRQKASLLLFTDLLSRTAAGIIVFEHDKHLAEQSLIAGEIDPRIVIALLPKLRDEVEQGIQGIWISGGLKQCLERFLQVYDVSSIRLDVQGPYGDNLLSLVKRYLFHWRRKKGFGSIPDETHVFKTVDAALLHTLLLLDSVSPRGPGTKGSVRLELNSVVDSGLDCFDRGVELLEQFNRLFVLSRLYQSRKDHWKVLATWKRILEGQPDAGGDFVDGEQAVRNYLSRLRDVSAVEEYGTWLANRNPALGIKVFADDSSRVKFEPAEAIKILKQKAPGAVKYLLEHLVFDKNLAQYANDLISYYLDTVVEELGESQQSRSILLQTYETYRALRPPKPTYRQFITENALGTDWWDNRLRLLQLLGGHHGAASQYDVLAILNRLEPYGQELVPEMIILNGRQGRHTEAIRLLTHGLGDFDTAISYCLLGGSSIFRPASGEVIGEVLPSHEDQAVLFNNLFDEFLLIEDLSDRIERTSELLERFGGWFDISRQVLSLVPDSWSVDIISGFLVNALRRLVRDRSETQIARYLRQSENLKISAELVDKIEGGPKIEGIENPIGIS
ncbi:hypothetical protein EV356DRAFT_491938 [Viridothelium virens]|uniref:CNH domain-containing protein n=1 Tax=Viridothelium virens TaxID=1048519 RepID=A0A6A6GXH4_VIRVR|nr:hypothetical protein EV356DRAFT_491938 [Viridothelium virens]